MDRDWLHCRKRMINSEILKGYNEMNLKDSEMNKLKIKSDEILGEKKRIEKNLELLQLI